MRRGLSSISESMGGCCCWSSWSVEEKDKESNEMFELLGSSLLLEEVS